jgi:tetratricopeptide (TPR) repeat protein
MALEPLPAAAMELLLDGFVPGLPPSAREAILQRAEGIPLYAVETVRMLVAEGRLERAGDGYRPIGELGPLAVPDTLRSLIASRLDGLDPVDRALLQDASVLGTTFTVAGLEAMSGRSMTELEAQLHGLVRRELLELEVDPRSPERGQYGFVQALIREVAYSTLARAERRARHLAVARFFESLGDDELAGGLAGHYLAAFENSTAGPEADAVGVQARIAFRAAAERSQDLGALDQSIAHVERGLTVATAPSDRYPLLVIAAECASSIGDADLARDYATRAVDAATEDGDAIGVARARTVLGSVHLNAAEITEAMTVINETLADLPADGDGVDEVRARLWADLARAEFRADRSMDALSHAELALAIAEPLHLDHVIADAFNNRAAALSYLGRRREAWALLEAAIKIAADAGLLGAELRARNNLAATLWAEDPVRSHELDIETLELSRRAGIRNNAMWQIQNTAINVLFEGRGWDALTTEIDDLLADGVVTGLAARLHVSRLDFLAMRGQAVDEALATFERNFGKDLDRETRQFVEFVVALQEIAEGQLAEAADRLTALTAADWEVVALHWAIHPTLQLADAERARTLLERFDSNPDSRSTVMAASRAWLRAGIAAIEGRRDEAIAGFVDVLARFEAINWMTLRAQAATDFAALVGPDEPAAHAAALEARGLFESLEATPYVRRIDAILGAAPASAHRTATPEATTAGA